MPAPTLIITIAPDREGKTTMQVSLRGADGAPVGPPREVILNDRLTAFITNMQAIARAQLASDKSPAGGRAPDGKPAISLETADGE